MKRQTLKRALTLNKTSIANLEDNSMKDVKGGSYPDTYPVFQCRTQTDVPFCGKLTITTQ